MLYNVAFMNVYFITNKFAGLNNNDIYIDTNDWSIFKISLAEYRLISINSAMEELNYG